MAFLEAEISLSGKLDVAAETHVKKDTQKRLRASWQRGRMQKTKERGRASLYVSVPRCSSRSPLEDEDGARATK